MAWGRKSSVDLTFNVLLRFVTIVNEYFPAEAFSFGFKQV